METMRFGLYGEWQNVFCIIKLQKYTFLYTQYIPGVYYSLVHFIGTNSYTV